MSGRAWGPAGRGGRDHAGPAGTAAAGSVHHEGRPNFGLIWIKEGELLKPRRVVVGLTDGSYTEVKGKINEGDEVVTGSSLAQSSKNAQQNPFAPQQGPRGARGGH